MKTLGIKTQLISKSGRLKWL